MVIIGIDPGTATTGYGVIEAPFLKSGKENINLRAKKNLKKIRSFVCLNYGLIKTKPSLTPAERLLELNTGLDRLIKKYRPEVLAVENLYFFKNLKTAMPVAQAKGVILLTAAKKGIPVFELTPLQVKMTITGYGRAEKKQVQKMIKVLLRLKEIPTPYNGSKI
jgi:crossover junction endodeoxyribonuclease RuvC